MCFPRFQKNFGDAIRNALQYNCKADISSEEYNEWRYRYPELQAERTKNDLDHIRETD